MMTQMSPRMSVWSPSTMFSGPMRGIGTCGHSWLGSAVKPVCQRRLRGTGSPGGLLPDGRVLESILPQEVPKGETGSAQGEVGDSFLSGCSFGAKSWHKTQDGCTGLGHWDGDSLCVGYR